MGLFLSNLSQVLKDGHGAVNFIAFNAEFLQLFEASSFFISAKTTDIGAFFEMMIPLCVFYIWLQFCLNFPNFQENPHYDRPNKKVKTFVQKVYLDKIDNGWETKEALF